MASLGSSLETTDSKLVLTATGGPSGFGDAVLPAEWMSGLGEPKTRSAAKNSGVRAFGLCFIFMNGFNLLTEI